MLQGMTQCQAISGIRLLMKNLAVQVALQKVKKNKKGGVTVKGGACYSERIRTNDKTKCNQVFQGIYHTLRVAVIQQKINKH